MMAWEEDDGMGGGWHGRRMAWHGRRMAWEEDGMAWEDDGMGCGVDM